MTVLIILATGFICLLSFYMGLKSGNKEPIEPIKIPNPIKKYQEYKEVQKENKQQQREQQILDVNMENINNYDGTSLGQKDIPR